MSTYVMSDIHGCDDELMKMFELISFSKEDRLILAGDYVDRGPKSYEMLKWIETNPDNDGDVYRSYDEETDCVFYDIDCGCAYRENCNTAKLACIRLEDEKVFYV